MLSVIIPSYNEEKMILKTSQVISEILKNENIDFELIFIDDGSSDDTWKKIEEVSKENINAHGISFSRNFGKEAAIYAGLEASKGDCAVVIDCDLQHPPIKMVEMYRLWENGYEIVEGVKSSRGKEKAVHGFAARCFYKMISNAIGIDMSNASDYKLVDRKVICALLNMTEKDAFFRALSSWVGFKTTQIEYDVQDREEGTSKWSLKMLIKYALTNITSFTSIPLQVVTVLGVIMLIVCIGLSIQTLIRWGMGNAVEGFTTVIILQCFSSSILMLGLGIIGYYISKIYSSVQNRPKYIVSKSV